MNYRFVFMLLSGLMVSAIAQGNFGGGGMAPQLQNFPCLTDEKRAEIQAQIDRNVQRLLQAGVIQAPVATQVTLLEWPVIGAPGQTDYGYHGISNFVDQNTGFPNQLLDYNCGERTYDLNSGYNHRGVDIFTWPFGWYRMDNDEVIIVASAPGEIILKADGNQDRSCGFNGSDWNAVYVRHADGSIAWYGHMKKNSTTPKAVGESVAAGEYLGVVGSSGNSTGPHLHLELRDAGGNLIEPFQGTCNSLNTESWWADQVPYYDSAINALVTHSDAPVFPNCPTTETLNLKDSFMPGEVIYTAAYYRDQLNGQVGQYKIRRPDGVVWRSWSHASNVNHYSASYWYWWNTLPGNAPAGVWQFEVVYEGETYVHEFTVGATAIDDRPEHALQQFALLQNYPNPFNPQTNISYIIPKSTAVRLTVFDAIGREVVTLVDAQQPAGRHMVTWDGKDAAGQKMSSGVYYYRLIAGDAADGAGQGFTQSRQMMLTY